MDISREQSQRDEFCKILIELASNQEILENPNDQQAMYSRLEALYYSPDKKSRFRHFYSDIFTVLTQVKQDPSIGDINILGQNLYLLRVNYKPKNHDVNNNLIDISDSIKKLYDHVSLDIARILYSESEDRKTAGEKSITEIKAQLNKINDDLGKTVNEQKDVKEELGKQQKEYVAILGIFASVVLAFTGGIAFSTSVLENIDSVSAYRIIIVALIIGLVLINIIFALFYYIGLLVDKTKEEKSLRPLWISNLIILGLLLIIILAWYFGAIEYRDTKIESRLHEIIAEQFSSSESGIENIG